jgi:hypothetical protein
MAAHYKQLLTAWQPWKELLYVQAAAVPASTGANRHPQTMTGSSTKPVVSHSPACSHLMPLLQRQRFQRAHLLQHPMI